MARGKIDGMRVGQVGGTHGGQVGVRDDIRHVETVLVDDLPVRIPDQREQRHLEFMRFVCRVGDSAQLGARQFENQRSPRVRAVALEMIGRYVESESVRLSTSKSLRASFTSIFRRRPSYLFEVGRYMAS